MGAGAVLAGSRCIGPVLLVIALLGAVQRVIALSGAKSAVPAGTECALGSLRRRALAVAAAEIVLAIVALVAPAILPQLNSVPWAAWFGTSVLGVVTSWMFLDEAASRFALDMPRSRRPAVMALASAPPAALAELAIAIQTGGGGWGAEVVWFVAGFTGSALWVLACLLAAHQASASGDEIAGGPRRGRATARSDASVRAPRAVRRSAPEDDAPIPLD